MFFIPFDEAEGGNGDKQRPPSSRSGSRPTGGGGGKTAVQGARGGPTSSSSSSSLSKSAGSRGPKTLGTSSSFSEGRKGSVGGANQDGVMTKKSGSSIEVLADKRTLEKQKQPGAEEDSAPVKQQQAVKAQPIVGDMEAESQQPPEASDSISTQRDDEDGAPQLEKKGPPIRSYGAYGQPHIAPKGCAVPDCTGLPYKGGLCRGHYELHFHDLAEGGRYLQALDYGLEKCVVKDCGGDVYKLGYCEEHYAQNERDLVDSVEMELAGLNNPYNKEHRENPHVLDAKQRRKAEQEMKDRQAREALKQAMADRDAFKKARKEREDGGRAKQAEDEARRQREIEEEEARRQREKDAAQLAALERMRKEQEALRTEAEIRRLKKEKEEAEKEEEAIRERIKREKKEAEDLREAMKREREEELKRLRADRDSEMEKARREHEEELARIKRDQEEEQEMLRRAKEAEQEALRRIKDEQDQRTRDEDNERRKQERLKRKEEERLRKEMEVRAATEMVYGANKAIKDKNRSELLKDQLPEHLVRDLDEQGKPRFSSATTYAEAHQQWKAGQDWESDAEGILGASADGLVFRSYEGFTKWTLLSHLEVDDPPGPVALNCMVRTSGGRYYGISNNSGKGARLLSFNPLTGQARALSELHAETGPIKRVAAACCSQWLNQKHLEQIFVVVKKGSLPDVAGDTICRLDLHTGRCDLIFTSRRTDIAAITAPPLSGGPWHGTVFFVWSRGGGLMCVQWANEGYTERCLGASAGQTEEVRSLAFSSTGTVLYAMGDAIDGIDPQTGASLGTLPSPSSFVAAVWDADLPPTTMMLGPPSAAPSPCPSPVPPAIADRELDTIPPMIISSNRPKTAAPFSGFAGGTELLGLGSGNTGGRPSTSMGTRPMTSAGKREGRGGGGGRNPLGA